MDKRVVVTGIGLATPLGLTVADNLDALTNGFSGISNISSFNCQHFPVKIAGEIKGFDPAKYVKKKKSLKLMNRTIQLAVAATDMAVNDAGIIGSDNFDPSKVGISLGMEGTQYTIDELSAAFAASADENKEFDFHKFGTDGLRALNPLWPLTILPNMSLCHLAINYNIQGPNMTFCSLASGGSQAIGEAFNAIKYNEADMFIAGGSVSVNPITITYLALHNLFSSKNDNPGEACSPFDKNRDGLVLGEGAGILILEELGHAEKRGANILGEIAGYSSSIYGNRLNSKEELFLTSEEGAAICMEAALKDAGMNSDDIDYINADGQSAVQPDRAETLAIKKVFGEKARDVSISSTKSMTGHLLCASGAVETAMAFLCIKHGIVPPTINYNSVDADCDLDYTPNRVREKTVDSVMINSFGLGSENASLIVKKI